MKLLLLGATGSVGSHALKLALANDSFSEVIAPTRKPLAPHNKLVNPVGEKLEELVSSMLSYKPDAVICALGTTMKKAGSKEAFRYVDYELPVIVAKAAHAAGTETFAIVTAMGASATSMSFYVRTKGEVEREVQKIGFRSLTICRPSLIGGERNEKRTAEKIAIALLGFLAPLLPKKLLINPAETIAAKLIEAAVAARTGYHQISSQEMN